MASKQARLHGRVEGAKAHCAVPGCGAPGEYQGAAAAGQFRRARRVAVPVPRPCPRAQCQVQFLRRHEPRGNQRRPVAARRLGPAEPQVRRQRRRPAAAVERFLRPARCDRDALRPRFATPRPARFNKAERQALSVLGLGEDADRHALRQTYSTLVRRYHPDKNGGDRSHEARLGAVIEAYQLLRKSAGFRLIAVGRAEREIGAVGPAPHRPRVRPPDGRAAARDRPSSRGRSIADLFDPIRIE